MSKPKVHRTRNDCRDGMKQMALKHIEDLPPIWSRKVGADRDDNVDFIYERFGMRIEVTIRFPDNCLVCGDSEERLEARHGRRW